MSYVMTAALALLDLLGNLTHIGQITNLLLTGLSETRYTLTNLSFTTSAAGVPVQRAPTIKRRNSEPSSTFAKMQPILI